MKKRSKAIWQHVHFEQKMKKKGSLWTNLNEWYRHENIWLNSIRSVTNGPFNRSLAFICVPFCFLSETQKISLDEKAWLSAYCTARICLFGRHHPSRKRASPIYVQSPFRFPRLYNCQIVNTHSWGAARKKGRKWKYLRETATLFSMNEHSFRNFSHKLLRFYVTCGIVVDDFQCTSHDI